MFNLSCSHRVFLTRALAQLSISKQRKQAQTKGRWESRQRNENKAERRTSWRTKWRHCSKLENPSLSLMWARGRRECKSTPFSHQGEMKHRVSFCLHSLKRHLEKESPPSLVFLTRKHIFRSFSRLTANIYLKLSQVFLCKQATLNSEKNIYSQALSISTLDLSCRVICMRHEHNGGRRYHLLTVWLFVRLWDLSVFLRSQFRFS